MAISISWSSNISYCNEPWKETQGSIGDNSWYIPERSCLWSWCNAVLKAEGLQGGRADTGVWTQAWIRTHEEHGMFLFGSLLLVCQQACKTESYAHFVWRRSFCPPLLGWSHGVAFISPSCSGKQCYCPLDHVAFTYLFAICFSIAWNSPSLENVTYVQSRDSSRYARCWRARSLSCSMVQSMMAPGNVDVGTTAPQLLLPPLAQWKMHACKIWKS